MKKRKLEPTKLVKKLKQIQKACSLMYVNWKSKLDFDDGPLIKFLT